MNTILTTRANKIRASPNENGAFSITFCLQNRHLNVKVMVTFSVIVLYLDQSIRLREIWGGTCPGTKDQNTKFSSSNTAP